MTRGFVGLTVLMASIAHASTARPQTPPANLEGTSWKAVELSGTPVPPQPAAREAHLIFGVGGRLSGADGCNRLTGPYTLKGNGVTFGQITTTQMACLGTEDVTRRFRSALQGTSHWSIVAGRLELYGATGKPLAVFERREAAPPPPSVRSLQGTTWRLVRFQGGDDRTLTPDDPAKYSIEFAADGRLNARIDCNRGRGTWKATASGQLELGPLALTRAKCPEGSLHDQIVRQWGSIRSYLIKDRHLFLVLMADGGTYEFEP